MANRITACRILLSLLLLTFPAFSAGFYAVYLLGGLTDMIDGAVARRTGTVSAFGARLDTAADFAFAVGVLLKLLPAMELPIWLCVWSGGIVAVKLTNMAAGFLRKKRLVAEHTALNKLTGGLLFLLPLLYPAFLWRGYAAAVCTVATVSALEEGYYVRTGKEVG